MTRCHVWSSLPARPWQAVFGAASYYAVAHPLMMLMAAVYFSGKYAIDKHCPGWVLRQ